jgi:hypothetical protein
MLQVATGANEESHERLQHVVDAVFCSLEISSYDSLFNDYFETIHEWMPIIDRVTLRKSLVLPLLANDNDLALLLFSMYLVTRRPCPEQHHSMRNSTYRAAKQLFMLQVSEYATLELLQAGLLITYYACGHGFPRDAYVLLTNCLSTARQLGITVPPKRNEIPDDSEWFACGWAIVLLDR